MLSDPLKIVVMGTGPFAVPMFRTLYSSRHTIQALFTQPARTGRGHHPPPANLMRQTAQEHGTVIHDPESINSDAGRMPLAEMKPDLLVVADYGQILAPETLSAARLGGINLHGSLLPKYRGAAPINWAIYRGDTETGVTVIHMTPRIDAGPCLAQARTPIGPDETAPQLEQRLAALGAPLVCETIERLAAGEVQPIEQDASQACGARRLRKTDGEVNWSRSAEEIRNQVRALEPWPRTSSCWLRPGQPPLRLIFGKVAALSEPTAAGPAAPGTVLRAEGGKLWIATKDGVVELQEVQPAGKRMMSVGEFLRGHMVEVGQRFGPAG